ncbi:MAG: TIGR02099 family protein [Halioglobus sp.]|nr:TIGR02099 family protein [Halioglobus sp.]
MLVVSLIVLLAAYVSVGRMLMSNLQTHQDTVLRALNARVPFVIEAARVSGEWRSFTPVVVLSELRLSVADGSQPPLQLDAGRIGIDVLNSLRTRSLQMTRLMLDGLSLDGTITDAGQLRIRGLDSAGQTGDWLREFLTNTEYLALHNAQLELALPGGAVRNLDLSLRLSRDGSDRSLQASLASPDGMRVRLLGRGVGDLFQPELLTGDLYLDVTGAQLSRVQAMFPASARRVRADGLLDMQLWLAWNRGEPVLEARLEARQLQLVAGRAAQDTRIWRVPLDRVSLDARLLERGNRWTLYASAVELERQGVTARLPRLQLDAWGQALRLRSAAVSLGPVSALLGGMQAAPSFVTEIATALQPSGELTALQLSLGDIGRVARDWELEANFDAVAVESWHGAPGVSGASGYVELTPEGGFVILDSRDLTLDFPAIYREPLRYEDIYGSIDINWDAQSLALSSGLVTAQGEEGLVRALFALDMPLADGPEAIVMDLLVGLQDSAPSHRVKYVPYVLNAALRDWLADSIGRGRVEQGAFAWRGALGPDRNAQRTIQLAFNIVDTSLTYSPDWPPVTALDGVILIDDARVSVWADRARLYQSQVDYLSAETWMNSKEELMLAVAGAVSGPAGNGLAVLNESPLGDLLGNAFSRWQVAGALDTELQLQLNLNDPSAAAQVEVAARLRDVDVKIDPGDLQVTALNGQLLYRSDRGIRARDLHGQLWGQPVYLQVEQLAPEPDAHERPASTAPAVAVAIDTRVAITDLQRWLALDFLRFADGAAHIEANLLIAGGAAPQLTIDSQLRGVGLDLPAPWHKAPDAARALHVQLPLGGASYRVGVDLAGELRLQLELADGALRAGSVGLWQEPADLETGLLRIDGHTPQLPVDEWTAFITEYFAGGALGGQLAGAAPDPNGIAVAPPARTGARSSAVDANASTAQRELAVVSDGLRADQLLLRGTRYSDIELSMALRREQWHVQASTDWLRGSLSLARDGGRSALDIAYLDLTAISQLEADDTAQARTPVHLPAIDVTVDRLHRAGQALGQLAFSLHSEGDDLVAERVRGELAGLRLPDTQPARLVWRQGAQADHTQMTASLEFDDLGQTLQRLGYENILETDSGRFNLDLRWPASPQDFTLERVEGSLRVDIGEGRFLEASSGASGALRVVNILNLADIVQRLSLSHMFESGIPFDKVRGEVLMHGGTIAVTGMEISGPSSFQFSGVSDVAARSLQGELVATLPVASNLPWVAALTAGLPVAAGVFVVSKVFKKQMNRLSSAVYSIGGTWDDPLVKFDHIFDDTAGPDNGGGREPTAGATPAAPAAPPDPQQPLQSASP